MVKEKKITMCKIIIWYFKAYIYYCYLNTLLIKRPHTNYTSLFILCRCLVDDFIYVTYLKTHDAEEENIIRINASSYFKSFEGLKVLADSNTKHFQGKYEHYLTQESYNELLKSFKEKPSNSKYFKPNTNFTWKAFMQFKQLTENITDNELTKTTFRAHYLWKEFSDFIHYSKITFEMEIKEDSTQEYLQHIGETLMYCFNTIEMSDILR